MSATLDPLPVQSALLTDRAALDVGARSLPPEHLNTGGEYRDDAAFIRLSGERIARMQQICFEQGMNFYVETHIDRISEDVVGFVRIMDACPTYFEVNAVSTARHSTLLNFDSWNVFS